MSSTKRNYVGSRSAVSNVMFAAAVVILLIVAAAGFGLYYQSSGRTGTTTLTTTVVNTSVATTTSSSAQLQTSSMEITALAYSHWASIGDKNLSSLMSEYASNSTLYWYVGPTSPLNGTYTGLSSINATWTKFLSGNPSIYYTVYNYTVGVKGNSGTVSADLWYVLRNGTITLKLPYLLTYQNENGTWRLTGDWWGLPNNPGVAVSGVAIPTVATVATTTIEKTTTSSTSAASSVSY
ncbi:MAG: hypothetical protein ACYCPW_09920 [Nitrososphaerales archaeon]